MTRSGHSRRRSSYARRWWQAIGWLPVLGAVWGLFVGEFEVNEWLAGGCAAVVAALAARLVMARGLMNYTVRRAWFLDALRALREVPTDFAIVTFALARAVRAGRRDGVGEFNVRSFPAGGDTPRGRSWRAFAAFAATWSPNAYVLDIDRDQDRRLMHDLVPRRASEQPG